MFDHFRARGKHLARGAVGRWAVARQPARSDLALDRWDLVVSPAGRLARGGVELTDLVTRFGSPLHVVWAAALDRNAAEAMAPLGDVGTTASDIFFSYKTNPVPGVLRRLHAHGIGAEVISPYELWLARRLGVPADRIIYNGPAKSAASLRDAVAAGVRLINANSLGDVDAIGAAAAQVRGVASLGLRISLPSMWGGQFGLAATSSAPVQAVHAARAHASLDLRALHFHRGFAIRTEADLAGYVAEVLAFCDDLRRRTGWHPSMLDLGGSLTTPTVGPVPSRQQRLNRAFATDLLPPDPDGCLTVGAASRLAAELVGRHARAIGLEAPTVVLEPGRALTGDTQLLLTTVQDVKDDGALRHAVLDAGMNVAEPTSSEYHQLFSATAPHAPAAHSYRLVGPICTPADVVYNNWRLPPLAPGHVLAIMDTGAYFVPFSTAFSFPRPAIVLQTGAAVQVLRRAETFEDLTGLDAPEPTD